ncbi:MAG: tetratricopeptide repeat protein [Proteobacteria bacterium]|nr:tetratricopeptide repeat protein [Pseudomonadota bacterium]MDA1331884.1 tetratricopeptide repeat protein [Pseudomonadota bacterium]
MAVFDADEQEQVDAIKQFWRAYGNVVIMVVLAVAIGFGGMKWWQHQKFIKAQSASATFNKLEAAETGDEVDLVDSLSKELIVDYGGTYYADLARLNLAKAVSDNGDYKQAIDLIQGVIADHRDASLVSLAKLRLSALYLITEQFDLAMSILDGDADSSMSGLFADMRGDIYAAQKLNDKARAAYEEALDRLPEGNPWVDIVQIKIDSLSSQ